MDGNALSARQSILMTKPSLTIELFGKDSLGVNIHSLKLSDDRKVLLVMVEGEQISIPEKIIPEFKKYLLDFMEMKCPK